MKKILLLIAFISFTFSNAQSTCSTPLNVTTSSLISTYVNISWVQPQNIDGSTAYSWQVIVLPCGTTPSSNSAGYISSNTNINFSITGLTPETCYCAYTRAVCSATETSEWSVPTCFTTAPTPAVCGGIFIDNGGANGNYLDNSGSTTIICPTAPSDLVKLVFTSFDLENNMDTLSIYDGTGSAAPLIGTYTGSTIPPIISSTNPGTCLTAIFHSNESVNHSGWIANVVCEPAPCNDPTNIVLSNITENSLTLSWEGLIYYGSEVLALPYGSPTPTGTTQGMLSNSNFYTFTDLTPQTCYSFYVRSICSGTWSLPLNHCMTSCENNAECSESLELIAFLDSNNNGIKDTGENNINFGTFAYDVNNSGTSHYGNSNNGDFYIFDSNPNNTHNLSYIIYPNYLSYFSSPSTYNNITIPTGSGTNIYYFPVTQLQPFNDLEIQFVNNWIPPRPGFSYDNIIRYKNKGFQTIPSGTITFTKDPIVSINAISIAGTTATATGFTYDFTNLAPNEQREMVINLQVPTIPTVNLGDILTNSSSIEPTSGDAVPSDNTTTLSQIVVGSYDPNEKTEVHGGRIAINDFTSNDYLTYTIQFENTGTASAEFIRVEDLLDASLDPSSIVMLNSSHNYNLKRIGNKLIWNFYNINLPPSTSASPLSGHGFVQFKIKPTAGYSVGTIIPNKAEIYFDYNPPIETNVNTTEFVTTLSKTNFRESIFTLYPNPASDSITINLKNDSENIDTIIIYDLVGKQIKNIKNVSSNRTTINTSNLSKGIYNIEIATKNGLKENKKLIIN